jgi:hypothetical protein
MAAVQRAGPWRATLAPMKLRPERIEDVPIRELSSLALLPSATGPPLLLAVGDRTAELGRARLTDGPLRWDLVDLAAGGPRVGPGQLEGLAAAGGIVLALSESPPVVHLVDLADLAAGRPAGPPVALPPTVGRRGSGGEGLLPLRGGRLLVAREKDPPELVLCGPPGAAAEPLTPAAVLDPHDPLPPLARRLEALASWRLRGVEDVSDLATAGGRLYVLSDQSSRVGVVELPLDPDDDRAHLAERWDLSVPEREGEPDGKPEGLVVTDGGEFVVGLDSRTPTANLCWYRP